MIECDRCGGSGFVYDEERRVARACACRPQQLARRRAAAVAGRLPNRYRGVSFDREPIPSIERTAPTVVRSVRSYIRRLDEQLRDGQGLWFAGSAGTGKTTLAMLVSKSAMELDRTVAIYSLPRLLMMLRETFDEDSKHSLHGLIDRLCSVDLLHIDDVGAQQTSPWVLEQLYTIVNTRYEDGRAVMLTTNLTDDELEGQIEARTVSRLNEMCTVLLLSGQDHRRQHEVDLPEPLLREGDGAGRWLGRDPWEEEERPAYGRPRAQRWGADG